MTTYPLPTLAAQVTSTGISAPSYSDILASLQASFQQIYGSDIYIAPDSQDGQWLGILAKAFNDVNNSAIAVYQNQSPVTAQGTGLSSLVKLNGLARNTSGYSTCVGTVVGTAFDTITNGVVVDTNKNLWNLPASVTIPVGGSISVTITAQEAGAIQAAIGGITKISNPQLGWNSFTNTSAATVGAAIESDTALKCRQAISTALPALTIIEGLIASVANIGGVTRVFAYANSTNSTDVNGVPSHNVVLVVQGGSVADIGNAMSLKLMPGVPTYGTTSISLYDAMGQLTTYNYFVLGQTQIFFAFTVTPLANFVSSTEQAIANALTSFINNLNIGEDVYATQALGVASLAGSVLAQTFSINIATFFLGTAASPTVSTDIAVAFNYAAYCDGTLSVTPSGGNLLFTVS